jgi:hypothetical protein
MRTVHRLSMGIVGVAVLAIAMAAGPGRTSAPGPYGSVLNDVSPDPLRKRMTCDNKRCVHADVTPIQCETAVDENCVCRLVAPPNCGSSGGQCFFEFCD